MDYTGGLCVGKEYLKSHQSDLDGLCVYGYTKVREVGSVVIRQSEQRRKSKQIWKELRMFCLGIYGFDYRFSGDLIEKAYTKKEWNNFVSIMENRDSKSEKISRVLISELIGDFCSLGGVLVLVPIKRILFILRSLIFTYYFIVKDWRLVLILAKRVRKLRCILVVWRLIIMAQISVAQGKVSVARTAVVKVATLDVESRIKHLSRTLIGRVWNPLFPNMNSLLHHLPKFWHLEDKVSGSNIGDGKFLFKFQSEEDMNAVLRNGPYHYDAWMVSLVRWEHVVAEDYPSDISFWIKVKGIPVQLGGAGSLMAVGEAIEKAGTIDVDAGFVRVTVNDNMLNDQS